MKVCFLLERGSPPRTNPILVETFALLESRGVKVTVLYPEEELLRLDTLTVEADLYLLKSDTELSLSLANALEGMGARIINNCKACVQIKNKVLAAATLMRVGIPTPRSLAASHPAQLSEMFMATPLILKPYRGYHGVGITIAGTPSDIPPPETYPDMVFAQDYLSAARRDLKVFAIGEEIFGVRKAFSANSFLQAGEPSPLSPEVKEIVRRCGQAFGLELYGIDFAESEDNTYVVDINYFPGYRGVPDVAQHLSGYILKVLRN